MKRREFCELGAFATTGVLLPATASFAKNEEDKGDVLSLGSRRLAIILGSQLVLLSYIYLIITARIWSIRLLQPIPLVSEKKVGLSKVPLLGALAQKPMSAFMEGAKPVGEIYHNGKSVFAFPDIALPNPPPPAGPIPVPYPNFSQSFRHNQSFKRVKAKNVPTKAQLQAAGTRVGTLLQAKDGTLIFGLNGIKAR